MQKRGNIFKIEGGTKASFLLISDLHFDNPKCDRKLLKKHLDQAVERNAKIFVNGDFFCLMQGKYDKRASKADILPQHVRHDYFQAVVEEAAEWFLPYKDHLVLVGYGNHETSILKRHEVDVLQMFAALYNSKGGNVTLGGYGGYINIGMGLRKETRKGFIIRYHHGHGGGGAVTKGVIQNNRIATFVKNADCIWMGHVHELYHHVDIVENYLANAESIRYDNLHHIRTSTYKEEFNNGAGGFHVESGRPPKPLGGYWLELEHKLVGYNKQNRSKKIVIDAKFVTT